MQNSESPPASWVDISEKAGWIVTHVNERPIGIVISITEAHQEFLQVAGYHLGESTFVGERKNILSIKVERIPAEQYHEMLPKIQQALPPELQSLPISSI